MEAVTIEKRQTIRAARKNQAVSIVKGEDGVQIQTVLLAVDMEGIGILLDDSIVGVTQPDSSSFAFYQGQWGFLRQSRSPSTFPLPVIAPQAVPFEAGKEGVAGIL